MSLRSWLRHPIQSFDGWRARRRQQNAAEQMKDRLPLREFVYLDAVSLHSLLVSQTETIPEAITQTISRADEAELAGSVGVSAGSDFVGKAETKASTRYQTSNSNSTQSSRKAVIQTLFKQLREQPLDFKLVAPQEVGVLKSAADLKGTKSGLVEAPSSFKRGTLVEVEVVLAVDPVFKLGTMMNEWSAMADDYPAMFSSNGSLGFLRESEPVVKILDRFLTGLIPIKATAVDYVVVMVEGVEYIVHKAAIKGLEIEARPLRITGVTEHLGFWKDIRRVLFSEARFTMLCRVARDGLHDKWTPVKLADLFSEVAPGFIDHINAIEAPKADGDTAEAVQGQQAALAKALTCYRSAIAPQDDAWSLADQQEFAVLLARAASGATDAVAQRELFDLVKEQVASRHSKLDLSPEDDLRARQDARSAGGLALLPVSDIPIPGIAATPELSDKMEALVGERILDTEVIAIYW